MLKKAVKSLVERSGYRIYRANHFDIRNPIATLGYEDETAARAAMSKIRDRTMVSYGALMSLWEQVRFCEQNNLPGAYVECGVWKGGVGGFMALANMAHGSSRRHLHLFDAFDDICEPDPTVDGARALREVSNWAGISQADLTGKLRPMTGVYDHMGGPGDAEIVARFISDMLEYGGDHLHIHKGWFQDTLPHAEIGDIAILRLDGDWYASTKVCLDHLYEKVVPGGFVVIDDYGTYDGCRKAVDEFLAANEPKPVFLNHVTSDVRYFIKPH